MPGYQLNLRVPKPTLDRWHRAQGDASAAEFTARCLDCLEAVAAFNDRMRTQADGFASRLAEESEAARAAGHTAGWHARAPHLDEERRALDRDRADFQKRVAAEVDAALAEALGSNAWSSNLTMALAEIRAAHPRLKQAAGGDVLRAAAADVEVATATEALQRLIRAFG